MQIFNSFYVFGENCDPVQTTVVNLQVGNMTDSLFDSRSTTVVFGDGMSYNYAKLPPKKCPPLTLPHHPSPPPKA
ncbi:hypothetical protein T02_875 [Trichinella nativa]|uniref:Uncharacterized protein n=1 Tax=Trichinella nativa TaxID=6335 RepID=A0A0V1KV60_9BILA|nr:hypothetical protein T02_875 [Trichinella nativa]